MWSCCNFSIVQMLLAEPSRLELIGLTLLTQSCRQCVDARLAPCLDRQRACRFHVDALAAAQYHAAPAAPAAHADTAVSHEDGGLGLRHIDRPFRAAHRGDRLRRQDLEGIAAGLLGHLDQQRFAAQLHGVYMSVAVSVLKFKSGTAFGNDRDAVVAAPGLRTGSRWRRRAAHIGGRLGNRMSDQQKRTPQSEKPCAHELSHASLRLRARHSSGELDTVPYHTQRLLKSAGCRSYFLAAAFSSAVRSTFGQGTGSRARSV